MSEEIEERDFETEARKQGWKPEEEFKGDGWVDAQEFVERGERSAAIQKQRAEREKTQYEERLRKLETTNQKVLEKLAKEKDAEISRLETQLKGLRKKAIADGDGEAFEEAEEKLETLKEQRKGLTEAMKEPEESEVPEIDPEAQKAWEEFIAETPWVMKDEIMTGYMYQISEKVGARYPNVSPKEFYQKLAEEVEAKFEERGYKPSPVEGVRRQKRSSKTPKVIDDLPQHEREDARKGYEMAKRYMPDYSEEDYVKAYQES